MSTSFRTAPAQTTIAFLRFLHDDQAGFIEIVAGETDTADPRKIVLLMPTRDRPKAPNTRRWFYLDPARPDLYEAAASYAAQLAAEHGNVYTGIRTYRSKARREDNVNPGRVVFVDDAPAAPALPYSASIRTSEHSRHGYYKADQPVTKDDARRAAAALGGDPSGVDLTQLVRFPGTLNTKNGGAWPVASEPGPRPTYTLDQLRAAWPAVAPARSSAVAEIADLHWPAVEKHLANIDELLSSPRVRLIKPETQTGRVLAGERVAIVDKYGRADDSSSMQAAILALGFYLRGFPDDEIAAIVLHHYREWRVEARKGTGWCVADIHRLIADAHAKSPGTRQSPTRYKAAEPAARLVELPAASRARSDRPTRFDPFSLFNRYRQDPTLCELSRKPRAAALGISTATLDRLEDVLEALDLVEIQTAGRGLPGRVILAGVINIGAPGVLSDPEQPIAVSGIVSEQMSDRNLQCIGETHPPPAAPQPPAAPPSAPTRLADLVREAFDLVRVDQETGEKRTATRKRIMIALGPLTRSDAAIDRAIADERQRRRIAAIVADIRNMKPATLRQQLRLMERLADKSRDQGTNLYRFADWAAREMRAELASRPAEIGRKPRKNCEALPDLRAAGARYQAELFDLVDQVLAERPRPAPIAVAVRIEQASPAGVIGGRVFPRIPAAAAGLSDRLRQRQAGAS